MLSFQSITQMLSLVIQTLVSVFKLNPKMNDSMADSKINELPNELLVKIFNRLDFRTKLRA